MTPKNYTPIDELVKKHRRSFAVKTAISSPKEAEPFAGKKEKYEIKEVVEHKIDEEVKPFVQVRAETIELPDDFKKMGLRATTVTEFPNYQNIKLHLSDDRIIAGLKQPITSSIRWFATLAEYILKQAHLVLKVINGKVIRVIKT
ncbi:hypothetical protein A2767_01040 [Candidatus Roizmanbacteria bacterium RIFCSPHIGHO2_01_FULL_35_10]|uniref:Uncharacterized protein n=1 Tax=Candidatus Roizmanbacteria bacterium RIFCSPLOWO2_01_FULL_35_13 TaxID=1802055 RepID=A0A1F7IDR0_9BACT|nr:MAG: hypothetical protein A2767_01040 [Candidatus Roizmanbacteria bacterium RIFCSPHIGHO2_01_FULL_35_10]OGK41482.1 MAG: hypothetical protein A3A74_05540 [Candidatus Roizmanbacteria bacterium RIFCSPLOWO2_01_FULL_35_13]